MLEPALLLLERAGHVEDLLAVLDRDDAAVAEAAAVARAIDDVDDVGLDIARPQKIRVQRVHLAALDGRARGTQRLTEHLAAVDARTADVATLAAKDVVLDALELEQMQQVGKYRLHGGLRNCG
ncbi:hypothetical protein D3C83_30490 [compost metagenome]